MMFPGAENTLAEMRSQIQTEVDMKQEIQEKARSMIKGGEGCISHMYLDTVGKVTIGVGNMLPTAEDAMALSSLMAVRQLQLMKSGRSLKR